MTILHPENMAASPAVSTSVETWPTIDEAAVQLGISVRTIWRYAELKAIQLKKRKRAGKKPENVCNPRDLEKLMPSDVHVMPAEAETKALTIRRNTAGGAKPWEGALERIATILTKQNDTVAVSQKLWLTLDEAAEYSGLARADLLTLCREEKLTARKSGGWKIQRKSLEEFEG